MAWVFEVQLLELIDGHVDDLVRQRAPNLAALTVRRLERQDDQVEMEVVALGEVRRRIHDAQAIEGHGKHEEQDGQPHPNYDEPRAPGCRIRS